MLFSTALTAAAAFTLAHGSALTTRATGKATFYGGNISGGTCSFVGYTIQAGLYGVAMTGQSWDGSRACGGCVEVTGPRGNKIIAQVVDQCPECEAGHLDLFQNAFAQLDDISKGIIPITWNYVNCPITSPIRIRNKEGTSQWWFSMQVINANKRVEKLEFSTNGGSSWTGTVRQFYNYFEYSSGSGTTVVDVRVTSIDGDVLIVRNVPVGGSLAVTASGNFRTTAAAAATVNRLAVEAPVPATVNAPESAAVEKPVAVQAPAVSEPSTPAPDAVKPAPVESEAEAPVSATAPETSPVDDCSQEPQVEEQVKEIKNIAALPTTLATVPTKPTPIAQPLTTPTPTKAATTPSVERTVTVTVTNCPVPSPTL